MQLRASGPRQKEVFLFVYERMVHEMQIRIACPKATLSWDDYIKWKWRFE